MSEVAPSDRALAFRLLPIGLIAGGAVALSSGLPTTQQLALVTVVGLVVPATVLLLMKPLAAFAAYLLILPLLLHDEVAGGMNGGELLTLAVLPLGAVTLWSARGGLEASVRSLGPIVWPLIALAGVSVVSLIVNEITAFQEIAAAALKMVAFAAVPLLVHMHADTPRRARVAIIAAVLGAVGVALYATAGYAFGVGHSLDGESRRASGTFEHWNQLGGFMVLMAPPTLGIALGSASAAGRLAFGAAFILQMAALLLSQTLGSVLALLIGGAVALVFLLRVRWTRVLAAGVLMAAVLAVGVASNEALRDKVVRVDERVEDRLRTYAVGVAMFSDKLWFGFGSEERVVEELWYGEADYGLTAFGASSSIAHNAFIEVGVEKGVFGAALYVLLIGGALWVALTNRVAALKGPDRLVYAGIIVGVASFLVQSLTNTLTLHARIGIVFFSLIALVSRLAVEVEGDAL